MIGKAIALIQVPNQRLFGTKAAAFYVGKHPNTLRKMADLGIIEARVEFDASGRKHRVFALEVLDAYIDSLSRWYDPPHDGESSGARKEANDGRF